MKGQPFSKRLVFALKGIYLAFRRERSIRFHLLAAACVLVILMVTHPPTLWWALGALTIGIVFMAELFNAALETLADHLHPDEHPEIGAAKDIAAGSVLVAALIALFVAVVFFCVNICSFKVNSLTYFH
jgi:undecaprenol kinase